jgi:hypothetical protein
MFGFGKKKVPPPLCPSNPGIGIEAKLAFANGGGSWTEEVNLVHIAADILRNHSYRTIDEKTHLRHPDSGFAILPQLVGVQPLEKGGVRTVTTMQVHHPTLAPQGIFEYQHAAGDTVRDSVGKGIDQWVQTDFVTLLESLLPKPKSCTALVMSFPANGDKRARVRRAILGPVAHFMEKPPSADTKATPDDEHPFCPCCLLTRSFEAFKELIEDERFYGLRLFAARDAAGVTQADCRVNGEDWERGAQALRTYVEKWPAAGYEFRKQYVVLQSIKESDHEAPL